MKSEIRECLEKKIWKQKKRFDMKRDIHDVSGAITEQVSMRLVGSSISPSKKDLAEFMVSASYHVFPVKDDGDYLEYLELINDYTFIEISISEFESWMNFEVARYFPVIFFDTPMIERVWVLRDESFNKDSLILHVDNALSYLSWSRQD